MLIQIIGVYFFAVTKSKTTMIYQFPPPPRSGGEDHSQNNLEETVYVFYGSHTHCFVCINFLFSIFVCPEWM